MGMGSYSILLYTIQYTAMHSVCVLYIHYVYSVYTALGPATATSKYIDAEYMLIHKNLEICLNWAPK